MRGSPVLAAVIAVAACDSDGVDLDASAEYDAAAMWRVLFGGTLGSEWRMSTVSTGNSGHFEVVDGALVARPGDALGLLWHVEPTPPNFELQLEWRQSELADNSGVFVRFPDIDSKGYDNTAYVAVNFGFEIQIDELGAPDGADRHTTGSIYDQSDQAFARVPARPVGEWNEYSIRVLDDTYEVYLNGAQTTHFVNRDSARGIAAPAFVGLQIHPPPGAIAYRNVRIRSL